MVASADEPWEIYDEALPFAGAVLPMATHAADNPLEAATQTLYVEGTREQQRTGKVEVEIAQSLRIVPVELLLKAQWCRLH